MALSRIEIKQLRKSIPHGMLREIQENNSDKFSYQELQAILAGRYYKQEIIDCVLDFLAKRKQEEIATEEKTRLKLKQILG